MASLSNSGASAVQHGETSRRHVASDTSRQQDEVETLLCYMSAVSKMVLSFFESLATYTRAKNFLHANLSAASAMMVATYSEIPGCASCAWGEGMVLG